MNRAMHTAATGMVAQQMFVDTIAHNLSNVNTTAYKKSTVDFQDLFYQTLSARSAASADGRVRTAQVEVGHGTRVAGTEKIFQQGSLTSTSNDLDLALAGDGFFHLLRPDGTSAYTRDGSFRISEDGRLVTADGLPLEPEVSIPEDTATIQISQDGVVSVLVTGEEELDDIGHIELAKFLNPAGLKALGGNLFEPTSASGQPLLSTAGLDGLGTIQQGYLEASNVDVVEEMINMIMAQRAYEISSKAIRTSEDMLAIVNNLRR